MNYTKEQILDKSETVLKDLKGKYYIKGCVDGAVFNESDELLGKNTGKIANTWSVAVKSLAYNRDFLIISDETGEPIYYMNFNTLVSDIDKDEKGYFRVGLPRD